MMLFTKRERWLGNVAGWGLMGILVIVILGFASGCGEGAKDLTLHDAKLFLQEGNAKGEMSIRVTGSPLSFSTTYSLGSAVTLDFDGSIDFGKDDE